MLRWTRVSLLLLLFLSGVVGNFLTSGVAAPPVVAARAPPSAFKPASTAGEPRAPFGGQWESRAKREQFSKKNLSAAFPRSGFLVRGSAALGFVGAARARKARARDAPAEPSLGSVQPMPFLQRCVVGICSRLKETVWDSFYQTARPIMVANAESFRGKMENLPGREIYLPKIPAPSVDPLADDATTEFASLVIDGVLPSLATNACGRGGALGLTLCSRFLATVATDAPRSTAVGQAAHAAVEGRFDRVCETAEEAQHASSDNPRPRTGRAGALVNKLERCLVWAANSEPLTLATKSSGRHENNVAWLLKLMLENAGEAAELLRILVSHDPRWAPLIKVLVAIHVGYDGARWFKFVSQVLTRGERFQLEKLRRGAKRTTARVFWKAGAVAATAVAVKEDPLGAASWFFVHSMDLLDRDPEAFFKHAIGLIDNLNTEMKAKYTRN